MDVEAVIEHLRTACSEYAFEPMAIYKKHGIQDWPVHAENPDDLARKLESGGHFLALPREPAALANNVEVALVDFLIERLDSPDFRLSRGTERGYPDVELEVDGEYFAIDVKVAKRKVSKKGIPTGKTQSRITLYTGNTFFLYPTLKWPGILRPFDDYSGHIDLIGLYTLDLHSPKRVSDFELIVSEAWCIASKHRSSTTREYLGAVDEIHRLRAGDGDFDSADAFYRYWRKHPWKIGKIVQQQLQKLLQKE